MTGAEQAALLLLKYLSHKESVGMRNISNATLMRRKCAGGLEAAMQGVRHISGVRATEFSNLSDAIGRGGPLGNL